MSKGPSRPVPERASTHTAAPASADPIQLSLWAELGPEGCAWYPAALVTRPRGSSKQGISGLKMVDSEMGPGSRGRGHWALKQGSRPGETGPDTACPEGVSHSTANSPTMCKTGNAGALLGRPRDASPTCPFGGPPHAWGRGV